MVFGLFILSAILFIYVILINMHWRRKIAQQSQLVKEAEAQLIQMEKMASIGVLAAGIAHEINNPLSFLISNLETLKDYTKDIAQSKDNAAAVADFQAIACESLEGAVRIKKIVQDLRTFSRKSESQMQSVDINQVIESTLSIVWNEIKYKIDVVKDYRATANIDVNLTELSQVFLNILINASQAIKDKGTITLSTWEDEVNVFAKISDTGSGIPKAILPKIFDPFFTTNKQGTGLGLSVSYNIVKRHNGDISVESKQGQGTSFMITLPKIKGGG